MDFQFDAQEPVRVWYYFEQLSRIPRGSRNTAQASSFCVDFAEKFGLKYRRDELGNVVIWKQASAGREQEPAVILQGHLDMVAEKQAYSAHDFLKDPLDLKRTGDFIYAQDTTLGGDDGIAVAYAMAVLEDDTLSHPPLVAIFTVDEEIGLLGAAALDMSDIDAKYVLNMDSESEGELIAGCAGGMTSTTTLRLHRLSTRQAAERLTNQDRKVDPADVLEILEISVSGLAGGHSGTEIQKERCNAAKLFGRILNAICRETDVCLLDARFGQKDNAIPCVGSAHILAAKADVSSIRRIVAETAGSAAKEHAATDPHLKVQVLGAAAYREKDGSLNYMNEEETEAFRVIRAKFPEEMEAVSENPDAVPGRLQDDSEAVPGQLQDDSEAVPGQFQDDSEAVPGQLQDDSEAVQEKFQENPEAVSEKLPGEKKDAADSFEPVWDLPVVAPEDTRKVANWLMLAPNGIFYWHPTIPGLVETSLNLGIFRVENHVMTAGHSVRSSVASRKHMLGEMLRTLADTVGAEYLEAGDYPGWEYREDSALRPAMVSIYRELFGEEPAVCTIHAGLECGYFMAKKPELDIVSFGPNIYDIHTVKERISISSVERGYRYVRKILETTL